MYSNLNVTTSYCNALSFMFRGPSCIVDASDMNVDKRQYTRAARRKHHHGCFVPAKFIHNTFTSGKKSGRLSVVISLLENNAAPLPVTTTLSSKSTESSITYQTYELPDGNTITSDEVVPAKFFYCMQNDRAEPHTLITFSGCFAVRPRS